MGGFDRYHAVDVLGVMAFVLCGTFGWTKTLVLLVGSFEELKLYILQAMFDWLAALNLSGQYFSSLKEFLDLCNFD